MYLLSSCDREPLQPGNHKSLDSKATGNRYRTTGQQRRDMRYVNVCSFIHNIIGKLRLKYHMKTGRSVERRSKPALTCVDEHVVNKEWLDREGLMGWGRTGVFTHTHVYVLRKRKSIEMRTALTNKSLREVQDCIQARH